MEINRNEISEIGNYRFQNFTTIDSIISKKIRIWRNDPSIRNLMYNTDAISELQHQQFLESLSVSENKYYWLVYRDNNPLGVLNIIEVDHNVRSGQLGYYLFPHYLDSGLGLEFISMGLQFLFEIVGFGRIFGRTEVNNKNSLIINYHLGFRFRPELVEIKGRRYIEQDITSCDFAVRKKEINHPRILQKSIREFNNIYKKYQDKLK